jgi:hypothetical protein
MHFNSLFATLCSRYCVACFADKVAANVDKGAAERQFRIIKSAYDEILKGASMSIGASVMGGGG